MPKKLTEEQKQEAYEKWQQSDEYLKIQAFSASLSTIVKMDMGLVDITDNWTQFLNELYEVGTVLKVPGRKAKLYEQVYIRTMFFAKVEKISIDGFPYEITNGTQVEIWNCKQSINDIYQYVEPDMMNMSLNADTYTSWKKELVKYLKDFDKLYVKHIKSGYVEMSVIHQKAMQPLVELMSSNYNFHALEQMEKKYTDMPSFRREALSEKFIQNMTKICEIFRDFGQLKEVFNIKQMLNILLTPNWSKETQLSFYLTPLKNAVTDVRELLLKMFAEGPLHQRYVIELNEDLLKKAIDMVKRDNIAQWLAGDELKQDQFRFIYQTMLVMYRSALKSLLLSDDKKTLEEVLPNLVAFRAIKHGKEILVKKKFDTKKDAEKADRMTRTGALLGMTGGSSTGIGGQMSQMTEQVGATGKKSTSKNSSPVRGQSPVKGGDKKDPQLNLQSQTSFDEKSTEEEIKKQELKRYGRMMIWEDYYHPSKTETWLSAYEKLRHINTHVIQDIEDFIMLEALKDSAKPKTLEQIQKIIDTDLSNRKKKKGKSKEEEEEEKLEDRRRRFLKMMRPPFIWNFFEEGTETPHILRAEADPAKCYVDGRIEKLFDDIYALGFQLSHHEEQRWKTLVNLTLEIFKAQNQSELEQGVEDEKALLAGGGKK